MPSLATYFLPIALFAIFHCATPTEEASQLGGASPRHTPLALLLRKRSLEAALRAPPASSFFSESMMESPSKRDDGYWIWMPAHGYMPIPRNEAPEQQEGQESMGNLLRYG